MILKVLKLDTNVIAFCRRSNKYGIPKWTKLSYTFKTIVKLMFVQSNYQKNFMNKTVIKLVQRRLLNNGNFHSHSNANRSIVKLVQKNCQMQEFTMLNALKFIMVKPGTIPDQTQIHHAQNAHAHYHFMRRNLSCKLNLRKINWMRLRAMYSCMQTIDLYFMSQKPLCRIQWWQTSDSITGLSLCTLGGPDPQE